MKINIVEYENYNPNEGKSALVSDDAVFLTPFLYEVLIPIEGQRFCGRISNEFFILNEKGEVVEKGLTEELSYFFPNVENDREQIEATLEEKNKSDSIEDLQKEDVFSALFCEMYSVAEDPYFWVKKNGKCGFLNRQLEEVIPFKFDEAKPFYFGRAFVRMNDIWSMIDQDGNQLASLPPGTVPSPASYLHLDLAHFNAYGCYLITIGEAQVGLINRDGEIIVPCAYASILPVKEGYIRLVKADGNTCIADLKGKILCEKYDFISVEKSGADVFFRVQHLGRFGLVDTNFEPVIPVEYESLGYVNELGLMVAYNGEKYGVLNVQNEIELPFKYEKFPEDQYGLRNQYFAPFRLDGGSGQVNLSTKMEYLSPSMFRQTNDSVWRNDRMSGGIYLEFGKMSYGLIQIDKDDIWYWRDKDYEYHVIPDEELHLPALQTLQRLVETNAKLAAKDIRKLFKAIHYWHHSWFDTITPLIDASNLFVVTILLEMAVKKPYGEDILAGSVSFFERGLELLQKYSPESYSAFSNKLIKLAKKDDKKQLVLEAIEKNATKKQISELTERAKTLEQEQINISNIYTLWHSEKAGLFSSYPKFESELSAIDTLFSNSLREQVSKAGALSSDVKNEYIVQLEKNEKCLEKIAKSLNTDAIKDIRDVFVVFRAWVEKCNVFDAIVLNDPVTEDELQTLQDKISTPLPLCFLESYRICNGVDDSANVEPCYMNGGDLLFSSIEKITRECDSIGDATDFISDEKRKEKYDEEVKCWVPVFNSNGNALILNLGNTLSSDCSEPIPKGAIFNYNHDDGNLEEIGLRYSSFKRLIEDLSWANEP